LTFSILPSHSFPAISLMVLEVDGEAAAVPLVWRIHEAPIFNNRDT